MIRKEKKLKRYFRQGKEDCLANGRMFSNLLFTEVDLKSMDNDQISQNLMEEQEK